MSNISYTDARSPQRIVFATAAFGVGVDCSNVQQLIYLCVTEGIEAYIQGTGRAGCSGEPALEEEII